MSSSVGRSSTDSCQEESSKNRGQEAKLIVYVQTEADIISGLEFTKYLIYWKYSRKVTWEFLIMINQNGRMRKMRRHYDRHYRQFLLWKDEKECVQHAIQVIDELRKRLGNGPFRWSHAVRRLRHKRGKRSIAQKYFLFNVIQYLKARMRRPMSSYMSDSKRPFFRKTKYRILADITQHIAVQKTMR